MQSLLWLITELIWLYMICVIISVVMSWLIHFQVVNMSNRFVYIVYDVVHRLTEPALKRIRRIMPSLGGLDLSPIVLLLLLTFGRGVIVEYWPR